MKTHRRARYVAVTIVLVCWLATHYALVGWSLLPANAIGILHGDVIRPYIEPFFSQNWHMFAPDPPLTNESFVIQLNVGARAESDTWVTEWVDVTTLLLKKGASNPLSPAVPRLRTIQGIVREYRNYLARSQANPQYEPSLYDTHVTRVFNSLLLTVASELYDPAQYRLLAVRGRVIFEDIPPFSELQASAHPNTLRSSTFDWLPAEGATR